MSCLGTSNSGVGQKTLAPSSTLPRAEGGDTAAGSVVTECWVLGTPESILCWLPEPRATAQQPGFRCSSAPSIRLN